MIPPPADRAAGDAFASRDGKITRDRVLAAAVEIIDRDGAEGTVHAPPRPASAQAWMISRAAGSSIVETA